MLPESLFFGDFNKEKRSSRKGAGGAKKRTQKLSGTQHLCVLPLRHQRLCVKLMVYLQADSLK
jgi:hypothetical protein